MEQSEGSSEQVECSKEQAERSEQMEIPSEPCSLEQTERTQPTLVEQGECSKEQTERSEQTEIPSEQRSFEQTERTEPALVEHAECSSEQPECSSEIPGCSKQTECSIEQTAPAEPAKDVEPSEEWSEPWLERFAEELWRLKPLWRGNHAAQCKPKTARGFAYIRLMTAMGYTEGDVKERLTRAAAFCKEFFRLLKQKMRALALECLDASPDEALRRSPAWVRRANSYLNNMPFMFNSLTTLQNEKRNATRNKHVAAHAAARTAPSTPLSDVAGARLMRRVVRGMRRAACDHGGPTREAAAAVAARLGDTEERVFALWCGMRKLSLFKLRALLYRGDAPSESGRLNALDWSVVDLLIMYGISLVGEASYQNYEQLSALLATFHLVQRFGLETRGRRVPSSKWSEAARWYSRNRVQMSALGLQRRWLQLKMDTRRHMLARLRWGTNAPEPLPLHQAIARRYEHVVVAKSDPTSWKRLVSERRVARPTSERGPAPGEADAPRTKADSESSDSDTAAAGGDGDAADDDDDDLTIIEKTVETIDLLDDNNDETDTNEVVKAPSDTPIPESQVSRSLPSLEAESSESISENTNNYRQFDKSIDVNKDIDAPSPKSNVLEALQGLDLGNIQTTILFESDEEDITSIDVINVNNSASVNKNNESHDESNRRESIDSEDGNLVIDCEDSNSAIDVGNANHNAVWKEIEREMIPEQFNNQAGVSGCSKSDTIVTHESPDENSVNDECLEKYPMLSRMLQTKSVYDTFTTVRPKVYYNTKRYHVTKAQKQYANANKAVSVGKDVKPGLDRSQDVSELASVGRAECGVDVESEVGGEADECSGGESGGQPDEVGVIDPKLLMYAVVILRRFDEEMLHILTLQSAPSPSHQSSGIHDESQILSEYSTPPSPNPPYYEDSPPPSPPRLPLSPPNASIPSGHTHSLFHYYAAILSPKFVFNKRNIPLLKQCVPCSVLVTRMDLGDKRVAMSRVAKKVELPNIEEVRRNNRSMLTAQVAPLAPRREGFSSPEPGGCSSDSDWTPGAGRPRPGAPQLLQLPSVEPHSGDEEPETEGSRRPGATSAQLGQLLNELLAERGSNGECNHDNSTGLRGPLSSAFAESCASCALRVLSAPPISGVEARLQRRLLRRLATAPDQQTIGITATTTTVTTIGSTATVRKEKSRKSRSKPASQKRRRPKTPPPPPRSPEDPEAAAREWLRQKNIAAEKFGVKPRSYKKPAPAVLPPEPPAVLQPLDVTSQVPQFEPPAVIKAMQAANQVPKPALNQPLPRLDNFQIMMREAITSALPPTGGQSAQPFKITCGPANKSAPITNSILLNQGNTSTPLLNQTNPVFNKNNAPKVSFLYQKASHIVNQTAATILNEKNCSSLFNTNAIADINKKFVTLAPNTEADAFGFHPVITNVHSLAPPKKNVDSAKKDTRRKSDVTIVPASKPNSILLRSQESDLAKPGENVFSTPQTCLPQVVNVEGGVHLSSASAGQALHLIVSQNPQNTNAMLSNMLNQPNMVLSENMIQHVQKQQVSVLSALPNYLVTSMPQLVQSQPVLVSCTSPATPTSAAQPSVLGSIPSRASQAAPMIVRSVQAGPAGGSQQNVLSVQNVAQHNRESRHAVSEGNVASLMNVSVLNMSQQNVSHPIPVSQQSAVSRHIPIQSSLSQSPKVAEESDEAKEDSEPPPLIQRQCLSSASLNWSALPVASHTWARGRDSTNLCVLCTGPREGPCWQLEGHLLVSEEELPASRAAYWTTKPRARLLMPGEGEPFSPAKRRKVDPDTSRSWLKVKAFARLVPDEDSQKESQKDTRESFTAPARVFVNDTVYQKLSNDPLLYAKLLVAVRDARACRALLARGAALQLYCLRTCKLFPLQSEPKEDVSRVTLSGDEDVSSALVALAKQLYKLPDSSDPQTPVTDADIQARLTDIGDTVEEAPDCLEPSESEPSPAKRPRGTPPAEQRIAPDPAPPMTSPPCQPVYVIELSDED